jgi:hypothetical protein
MFSQLARLWQRSSSWVLLLNYKDIDMSWNFGKQINDVTHLFAGIHFN